MPGPDTAWHAVPKSTQSIFDFGPSKRKWFPAMQILDQLAKYFIAGCFQHGVRRTQATGSLSTQETIIKQNLNI